MNSDQWFIIYLLGFLACARGVIEGIDQMHAKTDEQNAGSEIAEVLGEKIGPIYIDAIGAAVLILWPLTLALAVISFVRRKL